MNLPIRIARLEEGIAYGPLAVTILADNEADAREKLERLMLSTDGPFSVTLEVAGSPPQQFGINDKPHEYWVGTMERLQ